MSAGARRGRRGAEAIEFALVAPVFITLVVGMMDVAWLYWTETSLDVSTHIGCRAGALVDPGVGETDLATVLSVTEAALVEAMTSHGLPGCDERCEATVAPFGARPGRALTCEVSYTYTPLIGFAFGDLTLSSTQIVRMEWQRI